MNDFEMDRAHARQPLRMLDDLLRVSEKLVDLAAQPTACDQSNDAPRPSATLPPDVKDFFGEHQAVSAAPPAGEAAGSADQTRQVIGAEDRVRVSNTLEQPFCWVCQILSAAPGTNHLAVGTGAVIGPQTILTAAHNLYVNRHRANRFYIYLAVNGDRHDPPLGAYVATQAEHHPDYDDADALNRSDVALIHLDAPLEPDITSRYGTMPFVPVEPSQWAGARAFVTGYPKSYPATESPLLPPPELDVQAYQYYCISPLRYSDRLFQYNLDTTEGQSGGPLIALGLVNGVRRSVCIGVHVQGDQSGNLAIPLDQRIYQWIVQSRP